MAGDRNILPFEAPLHELKARIDELMRNSAEAPELERLLSPMREQYVQIERQLYENLTPWNTVLLARHPKRPQTRDYIQLAFDEFEELHGDRMFRDDQAIVTGLAKLGPHRVLLVGQHKGRNVEERHFCNAGCPHPEGYRKAQRKMQMAERFGLPVVALIDTKGAYPGIGSEERGVALAIAENMQVMSRLRVPIVCCVIGEGGSGGALGIGVGNRMLMLRHSYYSVISPEGCASILWRDGDRKVDAAAALKLTSRDLLAAGFIDEIVEEPLGGAHRDPAAAGGSLRAALIRQLDELTALPTEALVAQRRKKFRDFGRWTEQTPAAALPATQSAATAALPAAEEESALAHTGEADESDSATFA